MARLRRELEGEAAVTLVDIGAPAAGASDPVLRVHVRTSEDLDRLRRSGLLPTEVEGIAVSASVADYRLED